MRPHLRARGSAGGRAAACSSARLQRGRGPDSSFRAWCQLGQGLGELLSVSAQGWTPGAALHQPGLHVVGVRLKLVEAGAHELPAQPFPAIFSRSHWA